MRLGTQTASVMNHLYSRGVVGQPKPTVGMGATVLAWSDRYGATVIEVFRIGKSTAIKVQRDDAKRIDKNGMSESQEYEYTPNTRNTVYVYKQKHCGEWVEVERSVETNRWKQKNRKGLRLGERNEYYDFTF